MIPKQDLNQAIIETLNDEFPVPITGDNFNICGIHNVEFARDDYCTISVNFVDDNELRCPDDHYIESHFTLPERCLGMYEIVHFNLINHPNESHDIVLCTDYSPHNLTYNERYYIPAWSGLSSGGANLIPTQPPNNFKAYSGDLFVSVDFQTDESRPYTVDVLPGYHPVQYLSSEDYIRHYQHESLGLSDHMVLDALDENVVSKYLGKTPINSLKIFIDEDEVIIETEKFIYVICGCRITHWYQEHFGFNLRIYDDKFVTPTYFDNIYVEFEPGTVLAPMVCRNNISRIDPNCMIRYLHSMEVMREHIITSDIPIYQHISDKSEYELLHL